MRIPLPIESVLVAAAITVSIIFAGVFPGTAIGTQQQTPAQSAPQQSAPPQLTPQEAHQPPPKGNDDSSDKLPGLLSRIPLDPPLRGEIRQVRFAPGANYILIQDAAGVYVLTRHPLALLYWLPAREALAARFSSDSSALIISSRAGLVGKWNLPSGQPLGQEQLDVKEGCISAVLSADGERFACEGPRRELRIFRASSGEEIFADVLKTPKLKLMRWYPIPRVRESAFPHPIGYDWARSPKPAIDETNSSRRMDFSPDSKYFLLADADRDTLLVDLAANKKIPVGGALRHLEGGAHFVGPDKVSAREPANKEKIAIISVPGGRVVETSPTAATATSNPRYLNLRDAASDGSAVFDLESKTIVKSAPLAGFDISGDEIAGVSGDGAVSISHPGETEPREAFNLPRGPLATLRAATVSPDLHTLIVSAAGRAAAWDLTNGNRLNSYSKVLGGWCEDAFSCYLQFPQQGDQPSRVEQTNLTSVNPTSAASSPVKPASQEAPQSWIIPSDSGIKATAPSPASSPSSNVKVYSVQYDRPADQNILAGPVLLHITTLPSKNVSFNSILRALDVKTGAPLWSRVLESGVPIPFADPRGDRFVFGWRAESPGARIAASRNSAANERLQKARLQAQDTFFEVADARSGKMLGGIVVQNAAGPDRFDSAFSSGDWLVSSRDGNRLAIYSLSTGEEIGRTFGYYPAIGAEVALLAATDGAATLTLYDLSKFQKRATYRFPSTVAYAHFASDGKRLLVLTLNQVAYVLDVSKTQ